MRHINKAVKIFALFCLVMIYATSLQSGRIANIPSKEEVSQKIQRLQMPFITNIGQMDEGVAFYAKTFGGTVFVTKAGEIVYALPSNNNNVETHCHASLRGLENREARCMIQDTRNMSDTTNPISCILHHESNIPYCNNCLFADCRLGEAERTQQIHAVNSPLKRGAGGVLECAQKQPQASFFANWDLRNDGFTSFNPSYIYNGGDVGWVKRSAPITTNHSTIQNPQSAIGSGVALKETIVGGRILGIKGEGKSVTKISYFKGSDPAKWKTGISTYEMVDLGEVYDGIDLRLKAYGNNVEKLFYVKPGADPGQIKIGLSGIQPAGNPPPTPASLHVSYSHASGGQPSVLLSDGGTRHRSDREAQLSVPISEGDASPYLHLTEWDASPYVPLIEGEEGGGASHSRTPNSELQTPLLDGLWGGDGIHNSTNKWVVAKKSPLKNEGTTSSPLEKGDKGGCDSHATVETPRRDVYAIRVNGDGELVVDTALGPVKFTRPLAYQVIDGKRVDVAVSYSIQELGVGSPESGVGSVESELINSQSEIANSNPKSKIVNRKLAYGFKVAAYDKTKELIIDPLLASTFIGGSSDDAGSLCLDSSGNVYITGYTYSSDFPTTTGAYDTVRNDSSYYDVFVSKFSSDLTSLSASTYLGGSSYDVGWFIALDSSGYVYVTGYTYSSDFPTTTGAYNTSKNDSKYIDVFVSKLSGDLTTLSASTYLGGSDYDYSYSFALDSGGNVYLGGFTYSSDFPATSGAYDTTRNDSRYCDAFVSKLSGDLTSLSASTYLGGSDSDQGYFIVIDADGNVYLTGCTYSADFPTTTGAYSDSYAGSYDIFVSKLSSDLTSLSASTYLGGSDYDYGYSIAIAEDENIYVTGYTGSVDFPTTTGAYNTSKNDSKYIDVFVSKLSGDLTTLSASTYLGGSRSDYGYSIAIDTSGYVYVTGGTKSSDFPTTTGAYDTSQNDSSADYQDVFVSKLSGNLTSLSASTYLGGSYKEYGESIALDSSGYVYVTGATYSSNFPTTTDAYDTSKNDASGYDDVFISKFDSDLSASSSNGRVYGYITDDSNSAVNGAKVRSQKSGTQGYTTTYSDEAGYFELGDLDKGKYYVIASKKGYKKKKKKVTVEQGEEEKVNFELEKK